MAVTVTAYNHTRKLFANSQINLSLLKVMLLNNHTFDAADTNISAIETEEASGNGWDTGGEALASAAITVVSTSQAMLDAADLSVTATGGSIGPADGAVIYQDDSGNEFPLLYIDFDGEHTAGSGTDFKITWHANGIHRWRVAA